jgi:hypothetical protein
MHDILRFDLRVEWPNGKESGLFPFGSLAAWEARLGGVVTGLFGQRRQCRLRGKISIGQVIIPCISIPHFLY